MIAKIERFDDETPHADTAYRIIQLGDDAFGVEVIIPDTNPTTVSGFSNEAATED